MAAAQRTSVPASAPSMVCDTDDEEEDLGVSAEEHERQEKARQEALALEQARAAEAEREAIVQRNAEAQYQDGVQAAELQDWDAAIRNEHRLEQQPRHPSAHGPEPEPAVEFRPDEGILDLEPEPEPEPEQADPLASGEGCLDDSELVAFWTREFVQSCILLAFAFD